MHFIFFNKYYLSAKYGPELFIRQNRFCLWFHSNPGKVTSLPIGVGIQSDALYLIKDIVGGDCKECLSLANLEEHENTYSIGFNVWSKKRLSHNKSNIQLLRKSKLERSIDLHYDELTDILFLVKSSKNYFRGNQKLRNKLLE